MLLPLLGRSSGVIALQREALPPGPVPATTYCRPSTGGGHGESADRGPEVDLPEHLPGLVVEGAEAAVDVAHEHNPAGG